MSGYVEVLAKGDQRILIEAGSIVGVVLPSGATYDAMIKPDSAMTVILRSGSYVEGVYGLSAAKLLLYCALVRWVMRHDKKRVALVVTIEGRGEFEEKALDALERINGSPE